jgi:hypothetical protein
MSVIERDLTWSSALELLVAQEGEKCRGYSFIHQRAESYYAKRNNWIAIPVIVLSTLSGTASVGSSSLFSGETHISSIVIGLVSIGVGILNTVASYFSFSRKAEAHRIAYLHYNKLFQMVSIEMSLPREERMDADHLLGQIRTAMERLAETTPTPPESILAEFNSKFKDEDKSIARPSETNGLHKIRVYMKEVASSNEISVQINNPLHSQKDVPQIDST